MRTHFTHTSARGRGLPVTATTAALLGGLLLVLAQVVVGQGLQFAFDAHGNLLAETAEIGALPRIIGQPQPQVVRSGALASFFVVVADTRGLTYQWRFNGVNVAGATNDALLLHPAGASNEGLYAVVLSNRSGSVTSSPAKLMLDEDGDGLPDSWELASFGNLNQTSTGDFDGDGVSNEEEYLDGTDAANGASARYRLTVQSDGGMVAVSPARSSFTLGEVVTLTATAFSPYTFRGWTGDTNSDRATITLVMTTNRSVFAHLGPQFLIWTNTSSGDWHDASNWNLHLVPGANDDVTINTAVTVGVNTDAECRGLTLGNGSVPSTISGTGTLTLRGDSSWLSGAMTGSGRTLVAAGAVLTLFNAVPASLTSRTLENGGVVLQTGGASVFLNGGVITNRAGALFQEQNPAPFVNNGGAARIDNAGTFRASVSGGTATVGVPFNNYGAVEIQGGALSLNGGGLNAGTFDVPAGTALIFAGGTTVSSGSPRITGAGNLTFRSGAATLAGLVNVSGTNLFGGGTAHLTGNYICTNNTLVISAGTANFNGTGAVTPTLLNLINGTLGGSQDVAVLGRMNWTGGTMSGSGRTIIATGATLDVANVNPVALTARTLENGGVVLQTGGGNLLLNGGIITNRAGALFQKRSSPPIINNGGAPRIDNAGTFRASVSGGTATVGVPFNNYGAVEIQGGALSLNGGGLNAGTFDVPAGTALIFAGGTTVSSGSPRITGAGNLTVSSGSATLAGLVNVSGTNLFGGGTVNLTGNYNCANTLVISAGTANFNGTGAVAPALLNLSNGTLGGSQDVVARGRMNWTGGTMSGNGRTIIATGATLNIDNTGRVALTTRTLENSGMALQTGGGSIFLTGGIITNRAGALFQAQNPAPFVNNGGTPRIDNAGTFRASVSGGTTTIGVPFNNYGAVEIHSGILAASRGYASTANSRLHCAIGGTTVGTGYGQLQVAGTVTLNGALEVSLAHGFAPAPNDTFTLLAAGARKGAFASFSYPTNEVTMQLSQTVNAVVAQVTATGVPRPLLLSPTLSGTNLTLTWTAISNTTYRLEFNPGLDPSRWDAIPGDVTGLGHAASKSDSLTPSNRFYRVRVLP